MQTPAGGKPHPRKQEEKQAGAAGSGRRKEGRRGRPHFTVIGPAACSLLSWLLHAFLCVLGSKKPLVKEADLALVKNEVREEKGMLAYVWMSCISSMAV